MDPFSKQVGEKNTLRRSQRVFVSIPVYVVLAKPNQRSISEQNEYARGKPTRSIDLVGDEISCGRPVTLVNPQTDEQQSARVIHLGPRQSEKQEVGIEFAKPSPLFWRTAFPPSDWTIEHEDAKGFAKRVPPQSMG